MKALALWTRLDHVQELQMALPFEVEMLPFMGNIDVGGAIDWCESEYGPMALTAQRNTNAVFDFHEDRLWCLHNFIFRFKDEKDALMFKLRWL